MGAKFDVDCRKQVVGMVQKNLRRIICIAILTSLVFPFAPCPAAQRGELANVASFGELKKWDREGKDYGVVWEDSRDIFRVVVKFADSKTIPDLGSIRLEYWQSSWPHRRIPRDKPSGAGGSGWLNVGDWFQGKWLKADTNLEVKGTTYTFTFNPVNSKEFPKLKDFPARYRSTLKLRVIADSPLAKIDAFEAYTDSVWNTLEFEVEWGGTAQEKRQIWDGRLEVFNGVVEQVQPVSAASRVKVGPAKGRPPGTTTPGRQK